MKNEPEIVKELKEEERLGKVFSQPSGFFAAIQMSEETPHELPDKAIYKGTNGKRMEKNFELGSLEEKYWTIFENYSIAITLADEKERIVSWNKYAEELLNMNEKELFMTSVESLYPPEEWQRIRLENVRRKGIKYRMETKMIRKNQGIFDAEISLCTLRGAEGKIVGSVGIIKDISELKKTERKLIESELRYRTIFENSAVAITLTDENERIVSWNRYAENLLGMGKDDLYLKPVSLLYPMEEWKKIRSENVRQKGMQHHMETKILKKNSELIDVDLSISVLKNLEGKVVGSIGVIKDITERKKMERELKYERDLLQSLLDNIPDSIYFKDENSRFVKVNKAKAAYANVFSEDMIGKTDFDFLTENVARDIHDDDKKVMETGKPIINKIEKIIDADDVKHWVSVTKIPRYNENREVIGTMGISRDVTEIKRADDEVGKSEKKYRNLFETAIDPIIIIDKKGYFSDVNQQVIELLGYSKKDLIGKKFDEMGILTKESLSKTLDNFAKRMKGTEIPPYEIEAITKNGEKIYLEINANPLYEDGKTVGDLVIFRDLKERYKRKKVEEYLIESEKKFRLLFNDSPAGIALVDAKGIVKEVNKSLLRLLPIKKEEFIGKNFFQLASAFGLDMKEHIADFKNRITGESPKREITFLSKDNRQVTIAVQSSVIKSGDEIIGVLYYIEDTTERKKAENALKESQEKYRRLFDSSPDLIIETDENGNILAMNPRMAKNLGVPPEKLIGKNIFDILPREIAEQRAKIARKALEEMKNQGCNDERAERHFHNIYVPIVHPDGKKTIQTIVRDVTDQKNAENALLESEERHRILFESSPDAIMTLEPPTWNFTTGNPATIEMFKAKNEAEFISYGPGALSPERQPDGRDSAEKAKEMIETAMREGSCFFEWTHKRIDGEDFPATVLLSRVKLAGKKIFLQATVRDMTMQKCTEDERKKAEENLRQGEEKFRNIFDATSDFLLYLDPNGTITDINNTAATLCGLKKEEVIGKPLFEIRELFSEEDIKKHTDAIDKVARGERIYDYECDLITKNDTKYRFLFSNDCIKEKEEVKGILVRGRDVTQRQRAWDELVKLEEKYRVLAETSADGVLTIDHLGRLTYVNPSFEKMCGRRKSQILATLFRNYLSDDSIYLFQQVFIDTRKKDEKIDNAELELVHADGHSIPLEANIAPLKKENEFAGIVCTVRDITERKKMEEELRKSERLKTEFMNIAAHELKSPITPIKGYLDLIIQDEDTGEKVKNWAKISLRNSERLLKLIGDILDVSRLDSDTMRFDMEKLNPVEILHEVVEDMKLSINNKKLDLITTIPKDLSSIMGDRNRLSQVLKNLIVNAIKFTDKGSITIGAEEKDGHILIWVEDTGIGISKNELNKIFTKFYQAYTGDDRKNEGVGLGLFICKEIVQKHRGEIWAESKLGEGSQIYIKLPYIHKMVVNLDE